MKTYKIKIIETNVIDEVLCDLCGKNINIDSHTSSTNIKFSDNYVDNYGKPISAGWKIEDLCYLCANKLLTVIKDMGLKVVEY